MDTAFNTAIVSWIKQVTGLTIVFQNHESGNSPWPTPYATFKAVPERPHWSADFEKVAGAVEGQIDTNYVARTSVIVSVNIFHDSGSQYLCDLFNSGRTWAARQLFNPIYAALDNMSNPRDLTSLLDTEFKPRYQADFTFNYQTKTTETDYNVDKSVTEGKIDNDDTTIVGWDFTTP